MPPKLTAATRPYTFQTRPTRREPYDWYDCEGDGGQRFRLHHGGGWSGVLCPPQRGEDRLLRGVTRRPDSDVRCRERRQGPARRERARWMSDAPFYLRETARAHEWTDADFGVRAYRTIEQLRNIL